jgi:hypothetical protein
MSESIQNIISGHSISFDTGIAKSLGVNAALIFNHIVYWLKVNASKKDAVLIEDKIWMYETQKDIAAYFEFLTEDEVQKAIKKLLDAGLLIKGCFNKNVFDRTNWYTTSDQSYYTDLKKCLRNRVLTESESIPGRNQKPPVDGFRNRQSADCSIHNNNQEKQQKEHHLDDDDDDDDFFSKIEEEELIKKYSQAKIDEAKRITIEKCKSREARKKYFQTVLENFKLEPSEVQEKNKYSFKEMVKFPYKDLEKKVNPNVEANIAIAEKFIVEKKWGSLFIRPTYVEDKYFSGKDISLNMNPVDFESSLNRLYNSINR